MPTRVAGDPVSVQELRRTHSEMTSKAAFIRFYLDTGKRASSFAQLRAYGGVGSNLSDMSVLVGDLPAESEEVFLLLEETTTRQQAGSRGARRITGPADETELDPVEDANILSLMSTNR